MIIELGTLDQEPKSFDVVLAAAEMDLELDTAKVAGDIRAAGHAVQRTAEVDISGHISAPVELDCVRCLGPVATTREIDFQAAFVTPEDFSAEKEHEISLDDLETDIVEGNTIDLKDLVREQIILDLPIQVFCSEDCKGLCSKCGNNLNLIDCNCKDSDVDPRWAALKNLN